MDEKAIIDAAMAEWESICAAAPAQSDETVRLLEEFVGKTFSRIERIVVHRGRSGGEELRFIQANGDLVEMSHDQDCCEGVWIDDICGDLDDLIGKPILWAEEVTSKSDEAPKLGSGHIDESHTWTFYKMRTSAGEVTIRWYGTSNGYYSESVDIRTVPAKAA